jgi:hypothetical protein
MKQQIAQNWKITEHVMIDGKIIEKTSKLGKFTAYTAASKMSKKFDGYRFNPKNFHGFGGYWVDSNGNTASLSIAI